MEFKKLFRRKSLDQILADTDSNPHGALAKNLQLRDLIAMGIAAVVGAGRRVHQASSRGRMHSDRRG